MAQYSKINSFMKSHTKLYVRAIESRCSNLVIILCVHAFVLSTDIEDYSPVYTEVEPFHDSTPRPVLIFGVAAEALIEQMLEEHPETFVSPKPGK